MQKSCALGRKFFLLSLLLFAIIFIQDRAPLRALQAVEEKMCANGKRGQVKKEERKGRKCGNGDGG